MIASKSFSQASDSELAPQTSRQFRRDLKRAQKQGKDLGVLKRVMRLLAQGKSLPAKYKDHALGGAWIGYRDCHVSPDWVLIYKLEPPYIRYDRLGSHSDLFG